MSYFHRQMMMMAERGNHVSLKRLQQNLFLPNDTAVLFDPAASALYSDAAGTFEVGGPGINNPCPAGFRVPTTAEWTALIAAEGITTIATAYSSTLKLPAAGYRRNTDAAVFTPGTRFYYFSSTPVSLNGTADGFHMRDPDVFSIAGQARAHGFSVRPIWAGTGTPPSVVQGGSGDSNTYGVVQALDGRYWLDRNLGASRVATALNDADSYGWYYQWGRGNDGHQIPTSATTATLSNSATPGHGLFITTGVAPNDWISPQNNNLWQTGIGGPVGLRLDVSRGTALGSELVQDPALDNPASWLIEPAWSISNGVATSPLGSAGYIYARPVPFTTGAFYLIEIDVVEIVNSLQLIGAAYSPAVSFTSAANGTTVRCIVRALQSELAIYSHSTASAVISRVSARRVFGNHASQPTAALCPILRVTPQTSRRWLEAPDADDALNLTFAVAPGTMYVGRGTAEGVEWSTETWGTSVNTVRQGRFNSWLIARSREFTATEKTLVEGYYRRVLPAFGGNIAVNGDFTDGTTTGWSGVSSGTISTAAGVGIITIANVSGSGAKNTLSNTLNTGAFALISVRVRRVTFTGTTIIIKCPSGIAVNNLYPITDEWSEISTLFTMPISVTSDVSFLRGASGVTGTFEIDDLSVKEIL